MIASFRYEGMNLSLFFLGNPKPKPFVKTVRIKERVAITPYLQKEGIDLHVTASFGVATFPEDAEDKRSLLAQADQCLFESKDHGKNRIKVQGRDADGFIV